MPVIGNTMENQTLIKNNKDIIEYLAKKFPIAFILKGETKPLKVGIFQDIVARLGNESEISKTQLRRALRFYTSSWRYLNNIQLGKERIDLDGNCCGTLEQEHIEYAQQQLQKSSHFRQKTHDEGKILAENRQKSFPPKSSKQKVLRKEAPQQEKSKQATNKIKKVHLTPIDIKTLVKGQDVNVIVGQKPMQAIVVEIMKNDHVKVRLSSGIELIVSIECFVI